MSRALWVLLAFWIVVSAISIALHGPLPLYSTRTLGVAWEMFARGDFLVPHLNGATYSHKAPLLYWLFHAGWAVGGVGTHWPRVVMVAISAALLALTARLAAALFPAREAPQRYAPWVLAGGVYLFLYTQQFMFEGLLAVSVVAALAALAPAAHVDGRARWALAGLAIGAGLLTKGPVMLLHVAFPILLGPWWSPVARESRLRWYRGALGAAALGGAVFAAWLVPALIFGGESYRNEVLWLQTAGRVVDSFDHARPWWWYFAIAPLLGFPWLFWPALWPRLVVPPALADRGVRFLVAWLVPTFVAFCAVSAKQVYYLLPLLPGAAIALACAAGEPAPRADRARVPVALIPLAAAFAAVGAILIALPRWVAAGHEANRWVLAFAAGPIALELMFFALAIWLAWPTRARGIALAPRLAAVTLLAAAVGHAIFTAVLWPSFDVEPAARVVAREQAAGRAVATTSKYEGEYHYLGRLEAPLLQLTDAEAPAWAAAHPDDVVITRPSRHAPRPERAPLFSSAFREREMQIWRARDWVAEQRDPE